MTGKMKTCPGCSLALPLTGAPEDPRFVASGECWALYGELAAFTLSLADPTFPHQLAVDSYEAQHTGPNSKPITLAFGLLGLYLTFERGFNGRQVQLAHMRWGKKKCQYPSFPRPLNPSWKTVADVVKVPPGPERLEALRDWGATVWAAWSGRRSQVAQLARELKGVEPASYNRKNRKSD